MRMGLLEPHDGENYSGLWQIQLCLFARFRTHYTITAKIQMALKVEIICWAKIAREGGGEENKSQITNQKVFRDSKEQNRRNTLVRREKCLDNNRRFLATMRFLDQPRTPLQCPLAAVTQTKASAVSECVSSSVDVHRH